MIMRAMPSPIPLHPQRYSNPNYLPSRQPPPNLLTSIPCATTPHRITAASVSSADSTSFPDPDSPTAAFRDYQLLFASQRSEAAEPVVLSLVHGSVPPDFPCGTYYLTGPGLFTDDHGSTVNPLDGHGYLRAFEFGRDRQCRYSARYVATEAQREEREEATGRWRFTHRGPFSVLRGGRRLGNLKVMKNVANTSVLQWGRRLMCLWEGGDPYEIDRATLDTVGPAALLESDRAGPGTRQDGGGGGILGGVVVEIAARLLKPLLRGVFKMPDKRLLAHYKIDPKRNRLVMLTCNAEDMLLPRSNFTFYELDENYDVKEKREFTIPEHLMIHDWALTDTHYVLFGNRIKLDIHGSLLAVSGLHPMIAALAVDPTHPSTPIYVLPRFSQHTHQLRNWLVPIEAPWQRWSLHVGNAFEEMDAAGNLKISLQISVCSYKWFNFQKMFGYDWHTGKLDPSFMNVINEKEDMMPHLVQVSFELDAKGTCRSCSIDDLSSRWKKPADFPNIHPSFSGQPNTYIYAASTSGRRSFLPCFPFDSVVKVNLHDGSAKSWSTANQSFIGEPIFVPKGMEEDDGYVLVVEVMMAHFTGQALVVDLVYVIGLFFGQYAVEKKMCYLVILDARIIGEDEAAIAKLEVPKQFTFPIGFHGFWACR